MKFFMRFLDIFNRPQIAVRFRVIVYLPLLSVFAWPFLLLFGLFLSDAPENADKAPLVFLIFLLYPFVLVSLVNLAFFLYPRHRNIAIAIAMMEYMLIVGIFYVISAF